MVLTTDRRFVILLGLSAQVILTALFLWRLEPSVETSIIERSRQALSAANMTWTRLEADGRDLTISGMAPDQLMKERAVETVSSVRGIRKINDRQMVTRQAPPVRDTEEINQRARELQEDIENSTPVFTQDLPYELHLQKDAGILTLSGLVPDAIAKDSLLNLANRYVGQGRVIDRMMVAPGAGDGYLTAATKAIQAAGEIVEGTIGVTEDEVFVQAVVASDDVTLSIKALLAEGLPGQYSSRVQTGNRDELTQILRTYPELADRVGAFRKAPANIPATPQAVTPANVEQNTNDDAQETRISDSRLSASQCQQAFSQIMSKRSIGFTTASSTIDKNSQAILDELVKVAKQCPQSRIEIGGHTDDQGTQENNLRLSQRRAESVMEHFVRNGVSLGRLSAMGYGEDRPLVENKTAANRKTNRRIEFRILDDN